MSLPAEKSDLEQQVISLHTAIAQQEKVLFELLHIVKNIEHRLSSGDINKKASETLASNIAIWLPCNDIELPSLLTKSLSVVDAVDAPKDLLVRLRGSLIGEIYLKYLKKNKIIRLAVLSLWRSGIPVYYKYRTFMLGGKNEKTVYSLITQSVYQSSLKEFIAKDIVLATPAPHMFPQKWKELNPPHQNYDFPPVFCTKMFNAVVTGGTNIVFIDDTAICHDLYDFSTDYTSEELHGRMSINPQKNQIRYLQKTTVIDTLPIAASFIDACASNYAHWLTEVLPKICVFCTDERFQAVPIIINSELHPNMMASLAMFVGDREVIKLTLGARIHVNELWIVSQTGYVPFDWRVKKLNNSSHGLFSPYAFHLLKHHLLPKVEAISRDDLPKKIYLRRKSGGRKVTNGSVIETVLAAQGFVIVEPEHLSFAQQLALFATVDIIIGASGAAFANIIFCKPLTKIIILIPEYKDTSFWYWQNIALASGNNMVSYVLGQIDEQADFGIHSDFSIKVSDLVSAISFSEN